MLLSSPIFTEANPAVRAEVDWKKAVFSFSQKFMPCRVFAYSHMKKATVPLNSRTALPHRHSTE